MSLRQLRWIGTALLAVGPALAQPAGQPAVPAAGGKVAPATVLPAEDASLVRLERLRGMEVVNASGEKVGIVDDIVIDKDGNVAGVVIRTGGVLGIGGKAIGVAWRDVGGAVQSNVVSVRLDKDDLDRAPPFKAKDERPGETSAPRKPTGPAPLQSESSSR